MLPMEKNYHTQERKIFTRRGKRATLFLGTSKRLESFLRLIKKGLWKTEVKATPAGPKKRGKNIGGKRSARR